ncbi:unnamed protein product [Lactuca saligna]|uniref:Uncharacterized protein n=1 Tax=Lactuca saligna TaxID=75948 RepID=A0AA35YY11_LACSI|nr:unnamed protein product [Lactuca saligna]
MKKGTKRKAAQATRKDEKASTSTEPVTLDPSQGLCPLDPARGCRPLDPGPPSFLVNKVIPLHLNNIDDNKSPTVTTIEEQHQQQNKEHDKIGRPTKRSKVSKPLEPEPEFFDEQRELEDLWKQVFPVGTEWELLDLLSEYKWNFSNLEDAFEEGGVLHGKKVYLFSCTESGGKSRVILIPTVVAVVSPFPPSDKIGVKSVQREKEAILDMKRMKMDWVPYIPLGKWAGLKQLDEYIVSRISDIAYHVNFYHPFKDDDTEQSTIVNIIYSTDQKPVVCEFDWELDELEEFTDDLIKAEEMSEDQKDAFKEFVKEKVREGKRANREVREKRKNIRESMSEEQKAAFHNIQFYKFYPLNTPNTQDSECLKMINSICLSSPFSDIC